ncbi:MAG: hypothetical protein ACM3NO_04205, partial [Deltaproteobacteria bacterium]
MGRRVRCFRWSEVVCLALTTLLFTSSILEAKLGLAGAIPAGQTETTLKPTLKERVLEIPPGTMVEVKLLNKQKIRGRLGEITDEGFNLTTAQGDKIASQKVAFTEVKSIKKVEGAKAGHVVAYSLAGIGAFFLVLFIV